MINDKWCIALRSYHVVVVLLSCLSSRGFDVSIKTKPWFEKLKQPEKKRRKEEREEKGVKYGVASNPTPPSCSLTSYCTLLEGNEGEKVAGCLLGRNAAASSLAEGTSRQRVCTVWYLDDDDDMIWLIWFDRIWQYRYDYAIDSIW